MLYLIANGPMPTTSAFTKVTTGITIKTMLQFKPVVPCRLVEWGYSFDGFAAAQPGVVELVETGIIPATVTASVTADITRLDGEAIQLGDPVGTYITVGTTATGYTSTSEGSITAIRNLDAPQLVAPTNQFIKQSPLGYRPYLQAANFTRIRMTFGTAVNAFCYLIVEF